MSGSIRRYRGVRFVDIANEILEGYKSDPTRRTWGTTRAPMRRLVDTFGEELVANLTTDDFYSRHLPRARMLPRIVGNRPLVNFNADRKLYLQVLNVAYRRGILKRAPGRMRKPSASLTIGKELPQEHIDLILSQCTNPTLKLQIEIALLCGMRLREILHLHWEWIDFQMGMVYLPATFTKTKRGRRVPLPKYLVAKLQHWRDNPPFELAKDRPWVFPSTRKPWQVSDSNQRAWDNLMGRLNLDYRFHDLRHTNATRRVRAGTPEGFILKILGMSERVLRDIYMHVASHDLVKSAEDVSSIISTSRVLSTEEMQEQRNLSKKKASLAMATTLAIKFLPIIETFL